VGGNDPANFSIGGGVATLKSEARNCLFSGVNYSYATSEISTFKNYRQLYGYFEARIKFPGVTGLWPAFWMMPDRQTYGWTGGYYQSYLKFDLTGANISQVTSAQLKLTASGSNTGVNNVLILKLRDDSWSESTLTWNNKPAYDPAWIKQYYNHPYSVGDQITTDVTDFVAEKVAGNKKVSFVLADTFMKTQAVKFYSREAGTQSLRPQLIINGVTYYATEDAYVQWSQADTPHPSGTDLIIREDWGNAVSTYDGGMEMDIMESLGKYGADTSSHAIHWDGYGADHQAAGSGWVTSPPTGDGFHTYGMYWAPGLLEYYIDGTKTWSWADSRVSSVPEFMILSLQLGGWDGNTAGPQVDNQLMQVDYVRAWSGTKLSGGWSSQDIGSVAASGSFGALADTYTVIGSGADITGTNDAFRYACQSVTDDCVITARVASQGNTNSWAKAGVMIRESMAADAKNLMMDVTPGHGLIYQYRPLTDGTTTNVAVGSGSAPRWLRIVRMGDLFTLYNSVDGSSWTLSGSCSVEMGSEVYAGLAVCSHTNGTLSTATFDNVTISALANVIVDNAASTGVTVTGTWTASTSTQGYYGSNYLHDGNTGQGTKSVRFTPTLASGGNYEVFAWWTGGTLRATNVPIDIVTSTGTSTVYVNQQVNGGQWVSLGTYSFSSGTSGSVLIRNTGASSYVIADAVRFQQRTVAQLANVIMDNTDASGVLITGTWTASTATQGYYGSNYLHDGNTGQGTKSVCFTPTLPSAGNYEVFARWTGGTLRATSVPIDINYANGTSTVAVNQQLNGGQWMSLGIYPFNAGANGSVVIRNTATNSYVIADAVRFQQR
jgi:beta-glucanase (GH16 family)